MKRFPSLLVAVLLLSGVHGAVAQMMISISADPNGQSVAEGANFNVALTANVPAGTDSNNVAGFDLYLITSVANSGYFSIMAATPASSFDTPAGPEDPTKENDPLATATGTGFVRNGIDQGFVGATQAVPASNLALETLTLLVAANTPLGTYNFQTTTMSTAGVYYSDVSDSNGTAYEATSPGKFTINVVPEPSAAMLVFGGVGMVGLCALTKRLRALAAKTSS